MKKSQPKDTKPTSVWWCETCKDGKDFSPEEMTAHLLERHSINIMRVPYQRTPFPKRVDKGMVIETYEMVVDGGKVTLTNEQTYPAKAKV